MRSKALGFLSLVLLLAFSTLSCAGMKGREKGAAIGATVGAATGAVVGAVIGHDSHASGEGAGVGTVFGGLIGGAIGAMLAKEEAPPPIPEAKKEVPPPPPEVKKEVPPPPPEEKKVEAPPPPPEVKEEAPPPPPEVKAEAVPAPMPEEKVEPEDVHFAFDQYDIRPDARSILETNARWIKEHPGVKLQIEGHCDERGTVEYNLALGERRARSVRDYLVSLGIDPGQLSTISYGEEKPLDPRHNKEAWAKNRRAHFAVMQ